MTRVWLAVIAVLLIALTWSRLHYLGLEKQLAQVQAAHEKTKADHAIQLKTISDTALASQMSVTQARDEKAARDAQADAKIYGELRAAEQQINRLMADVDAGRQRLRIAAKCPVRVDPMSEAGSTSGLDDGDAPELDPAARPAYRALREGVERVTAQLKYFQSTQGVTQ